jgi:hypothetical protein
VKEKGRENDRAFQPVVHACAPAIASSAPVVGAAVGLCSWSDDNGLHRGTKMILFRWSSDRRIWQIISAGAAGAVTLRGALVFRLAGGRCALLAERDVRVNGIPALPLHVLADRDEIHAGGDVFFFSSESPFEVGRFPGFDREVRCARCKGKLVADTACIACPRCRAWHHEPCWYYAPHCGGDNCGQATAGISWVPEPVN